ncbi:MAG TPA: hypothetical protein VGG30_05990 [Pirellulales bacterium]
MPPAPVGRLYEIAYRQKLVLFAILLDVITPAANLIALQLAESAPIDLLVIVVALSTLCQTVFSIWAYCKLCVALGIPTAVICVGTFCLVFPWVSIIVLVKMSRIAARKLQRAGVPVGWLGVDLRAIPKES